MSYDDWIVRDDKKPNPVTPSAPRDDDDKKSAATGIPWTAIAILGVAALFYFQPGKPDPGPTPADTVVPAADAIPSVVSAVLNASPELRSALADLYGQAANTIDAAVASNLEVTTSQFSEFLMGAETLQFVTSDYPGTLDGFGPAINGELIKVLPLEDRRLSNEELRAAAALCRDVERSILSVGG